MHDIEHEAYDTIVVGARAAGATTAMLLARGGQRVLTLDRARLGSDTLSTHALQRGAVTLLEAWGLLDRVRAAGTPVVRRTSFHYGGDPVHVPIRASRGVDGLYAPRRTVLDPILVAAAREAGARARHGVKVRDLSRDDRGRVRGVVVEGVGGEVRTLRADRVVGADGARSTVARLTGARTTRRSDAACAYVYGYFPGADLDAIEFHYAPRTTAGVFPTNDGAACVFVGVPPTRLAAARAAGTRALFDAALATCAPSLAARLAREAPVGALRSFPGAPGFLRAPSGPGFALVGDAAHFKDPATAHGITAALRDATLLARALLTGTDRALADYARERDALSLGLFEVTARIASLEWSLDELRELHRAFSAESRRELATIEALAETRRQSIESSAGAADGALRGQAIAQRGPSVEGAPSPRDGDERGAAAFVVGGGPHGALPHGRTGWNNPYEDISR
ncbi:MAG: FAD-dependent monooxygenase [Sandaracinaceae bacterium]|nr:FAD-dependent monooxygenase [Sandaracinaceae bacterium]